MLSAMFTIIRHCPMRPIKRSHKCLHMRNMALPILTAALLSGCSLMPQGRDNSAQRSAQWHAPNLSTPSPAVNQCHGQLQMANASFTPLPDRYLGGGCTQLGSVRLANIDLARTSSQGRDLELANLGPVTCNIAAKFTGWAQYGVARAAEQILGSPLMKIETMGSYNCRKIAGSNKLSEHAHANAIDISAFVLADGRQITVQHGWNGNATERKFLHVVRDSACKRFLTVLSPDYNQAHYNHFHVDMSGRSTCR